MESTQSGWNGHNSPGRPGLVKGENGSLQLIPAKKPLCCEDSDSSFFFSQTPVNQAPSESVEVKNVLFTI